MPPNLDVDEESVPQRILNIGETAQFSHHWLWSPTGMPGYGNQQASIQFGPRGSTGQIEVFNATDEEDFDEESSGELLAGARALTTTYSAETGMYTLYMDTEVVASSYVGHNLLFSSNKMLVAQRASACQVSEIDFKGCVLVVELWDRELPASEVAGLQYDEMSQKCSNKQKAALLPGEYNEKTYRCNSGQCIPKRGTCNGVNNCNDASKSGGRASDERYCSRFDTDEERFLYRKKAKKVCPMKRGKLNQKKMQKKGLAACKREEDYKTLCYPKRAKCNGFSNCPDGSDEAGCYY